MSNKNMQSECPSENLAQPQLVPGTIRVEVMHNSRWSMIIFGLLLVCCCCLWIAWRAFERSTTRILHPESSLSVLQLEESVIKVSGIDGHADALGYVGKSKIGIRFTGFARLGVDLAKTKFDLDRFRNHLVITLPEPKVTEVSVEDAHIWESTTTPADAQKFDDLECKLFNEARNDFYNVAKEPFYCESANRLSKLLLRNYYKRNYPWLDVEFK